MFDQKMKTKNSNVHNSLKAMESNPGYHLKSSLLYKFNFLKISGDIGESIQANEYPEMRRCAKNLLQLHISYVYRPILSLKIVYWPNLESILYFTLTFLTAAMESMY